MNTVLLIASDEWRYWRRSKLGAAAGLLALILTCASLLATMNQVRSERETRVALQHEAEHTFRDQPARHPHRMVHYGHYVFRPPTALAVLDPGVDPYTGTVIFLEGHRQNSATFSPAYSGAQAGPFALLTPALSYQLLVPLLLIIMGFSTVTREREAGTDRQLVTSGVSPTTIWLGKTVALFGAAALMLLPLILGTVLSNAGGAIASGFLLLYTLYLASWVLIITAASAWSPRASSALLALITIWVTLCIVTPRLLASAAMTNLPTASQIETDMEVIVALRNVGDGHNASDPAFNQLRANLLEQYDVERVEDLPINFRGIVAQAAEAKLTDVLNEFAERRMASQMAQSSFVNTLEILSPFAVLQSASMMTAGTDNQTHHRFLREAEAIRFQFVQDLNQVHTEKMAYSDDINRSSDSDAERRTRIDPENWRILKDFEFHAAPATQRLAQLAPSLLVISLWVLIAGSIGWLGARRLVEVNRA